MKTNNFFEPKRQKEKNIHFKKWLSQFLNVDLPIGDLAKDVYYDKKFPTKINKTKRKAGELYLKTTGADTRVIEVYNECFDFYEAST